MRLDPLLCASTKSESGQIELSPRSSVVTATVLGRIHGSRVGDSLEHWESQLKPAVVQPSTELLRPLVYRYGRLKDRAVGGGCSKVRSVDRQGSEVRCFIAHWWSSHLCRTRLLKVKSIAVLANNPSTCGILSMFQCYGDMLEVLTLEMQQAFYINSLLRLWLNMVLLCRHPQGRHCRYMYQSKNLFR